MNNPIEVGVVYTLYCLCYVRYLPLPSIGSIGSTVWCPAFLSPPPAASLLSNVTAQSEKGYS